MFLQRFLLFGVFSFFLVLNASAESIGLKVMDTIAGYSTTLSTTKMEANTNITIQVQKPNGSIINLPARSNDVGYAEVELDKYHTKTAGMYTAAVAEDNKDFGSLTAFEVFPGTFSSVQSQIITDNASLAAKYDTLTLRVELKDQYKNPLEGRPVQVLSSRTEDVIEADTSNVTDENGIAVFNVTSDTAGVSIFTAIDMNSNKDIHERSKVVFYEEEKTSFGGNDFSASLIADNGNEPSSDYRILDHFEIEFPNEVEINSDQNHLKIVAKDAYGNTVQNYTGTVKIAVNGDDNAIIPNEGEYTFTEKDQGEKEFALAMIFTTLGQVSIEVYDFEDGEINFDLSGEKTVTVVREQKDQDSGPQTASDIQIKAPSNGSQLANSTVSVSGLAVPNTNLKLMLDDVKVAEIETDLEGFFATSIQGVNDGDHEIYVMESEGLRRASAAVQFSVDATAPIIDTLTLFPQDAVYPQTSYTFTVYSESNLDYVKIRVAGTEEPLIESSISPGKYEGSFFAPAEVGSYDIDVIMADTMGNVGNFLKQATLNVVEKVIIKPATPQDVTVEGMDTKIDVSWNAVSGEKQVEHYNVYLGTSLNDMKAQTQSQTTKALLQGLNNDTTYYIQVSAVDTEGIESDRSAVISATPQKKTAPNSDEVFHGSLQGNPLRAIPGNGKVTLSWDSFKGAEKYLVSFGVESENYEMHVLTENNATSLVVNDLINDLPYYFTVAATDTDGFPLSQRYPEVEATPKGFGFSIIPSKKIIPQASVNTDDIPQLNQTGPEHWVFAILSLFSAAGFTLIKRRRVSVNAAPVQQPVIKQQATQRIQF